MLNTKSSSCTVDSISTGKEYSTLQKVSPFEKGGKLSTADFTTFFQKETTPEVFILLDVGKDCTIE